MNTSKSYYCYEGEQREIFLGVLTRFAGFRKGLSGENIPFRQEGMADKAYPVAPRVIKSG